MQNHKIETNSELICEDGSIWSNLIFIKIIGSDTLWFPLPPSEVLIELQSLVLDLGDNCIQNFHLGRYIVGYTVGKFVLRRRASGAIQRDFRPYIWRYTSPNGNFEYNYPHSNALLKFRLKLERCKPHKAAQRRTSPNEMWRMQCKILTLSNQTSRYKSKCIIISV